MNVKQGAEVSLNIREQAMNGRTPLRHCPTRPACAKPRQASFPREENRMSDAPSRPRRPQSALEKAEALFKPAPPKAEAPAPRGNPVPAGKEPVSLRLDRDVLAYFQDDGPGWQDRINAALRKAAGL
jgi:uncharacterized protein (DUF4415 family)